MSKGLIFSIISVLMFSSLLIASINLSSRLNDETRFINHEIPNRVLHNAYITISRDISNIYGTKIIGLSNTTINDRLLHNISFNNYLSFINNIYSNSVGINVSIINNDYRVFINNTIIDYGINKSWVNISKGRDYYYIRVNLSDNINDCYYDWVWESSGLFINLTLINSNGSLVIINNSLNGYVNPSRINGFVLLFNNSSVDVALRDWLFINTSQQINSSIITNITGHAYTSKVLIINNSIINSSINFNSSLR